MNKQKSILVIILAILILPTLAISDLIRTLQGKQSIDEEWHDIYVYSNMNHGQGRKRNERISERGEIDGSNME